MFFNEICDCHCHNVGVKIMHCAPCCYHCPHCCLRIDTSSYTKHIERCGNEKEAMEEAMLLALNDIQALKDSINKD